MNRDVVTGAVLVGAGAWIVWQAQSFPTLAGMTHGPGLFPTIAGGGLALCGALILATGLLAADRATQPALDEPAPSLRGWRNAAAVVLAVVAFALGLNPLGFHLVAIPLLLGLLRLFGASWLLSAVLALGVSALVHFIFYSVLHVPLPWGLMEPFAW